MAADNKKSKEILEETHSVMLVGPGQQQLLSKSM
jgi:hypothetical protein